MARDKRSFLPMTDNVRLLANGTNYSANGTNYSANGTSLLDATWNLSQQEIQLDYDLSSKELEIENEQNKRAHRLVQLIVGGFALVLFLLLYMVFYGSEAQADKAEKLLIGIILLLGGASLRDLIGRVQKRLINR